MSFLVHSKKIHNHKGTARQLCDLINQKIISMAQPLEQKSSASPLVTFDEAVTNLQSLHETTQNPTNEACRLSRFSAPNVHNIVQILFAETMKKEKRVFDLLQLYENDNFIRQLSCALLQLVREKASCTQISTTIITMAERARHQARSPPPSSLPFEYALSSPHSVTDLTNEVEQLLLHEVEKCTYRKIKDFHTKHFGADWTIRAREIAEKAKAAQWLEEKGWAELPESPEEPTMWKWLDKFQKTYLPDEKCRYHTSHLRKVSGQTTRRQLDVLSKLKQPTRDVNPKDGDHDSHHFRDILVVGELKKTYDQSRFEKDFLQLAGLVREVFASQPLRLFVHAFTIAGPTMETWVFDRSGPYSGEAFNIHENPQRFVEIICGYLMMSGDELGLNPFLTRDERGKLCLTLSGDEGCPPSRWELEDDCISLQKAIAWRATTCYRIKRTDETGSEGSFVAKFSWVDKSRTSEADVLREAEEKGVKGIPRLFASKDFISTEDLRKGLTFSDPHPFRSSTKTISSASLRSSRRKDGSKSSSQSPGPSWVARVLRLLIISPCGRDIAEFESPLQLLESLRDAIKAHQDLYERGEMLHRDISATNMVMTNPEDADGFKTILIDLHLAKCDFSVAGDSVQFSGTSKFAAPSVLQGGMHTCKSDLESFFYVFLWLCAKGGPSSWRQELPDKSPPKSLLDSWNTGDFSDLARVKSGDVSNKAQLQRIMDEFPPPVKCVQSVCNNLRRILFPPDPEDLPVGLQSSLELQGADNLYKRVIEEFDHAIKELGDLAGKD